MGKQAGMVAIDDLLNTSGLIYSEMLGLRPHGGNFQTCGQLPEGVIVRGRIDDRIAEGWYQRVRVPARNGQHRGLDWKAVRIDQLPPRLKAEALLMGIPL